MMEGLFWRILAAVLAVAFVFMILPPLFGLLRVTPDPNLLTIIQLCVAAIAVFYILKK